MSADPEKIGDNEPTGDDQVDIDHHVPGRFTVEYQEIPGVASVCTITGETGELGDALRTLATLLDQQNSKKEPKA